MNTSNDKKTDKKPMREHIACDSVGPEDSLTARTACMIAHPGKMILFPFVAWFEKRYAGRYRFARLFFAFDLLLIGFALGLLSVAVFFVLSAGYSIEDDIMFHATAAPSQITTGAPSTLVIHFRNDSDEELRNARLQVSFPDHFLRQAVLYEEKTIDRNIIDVGTIPPQGTGSVKIRGVMFGDVGGEQVFDSILQFRYGEDNAVGYKADRHVFSPSRSALDLTLSLPDRLVAFQPFSGVIAYHNTGPVDFPEITIRPQWPDTFTLGEYDAPYEDGAFHLPAIDSGESGEVKFSGALGDEGEQVLFRFHPSFKFDETTYTQETLVHTSPIIPPQIDVQHSLDNDALRPGTTAQFTVSYENTGEEAVRDVSVGIETDSPFIRQERILVDAQTHPELARVAPGARGTVTITAPLRAFIHQSETSQYEQIDVTSRAVATYTLENGDIAQEATSKGNDVRTPLTTPVVFRSFGRYSTPTGDQLGRGPLPPRVHEETRYWIFWNVDGTTNPMTNARIEGRLPANVRFTGRQTVSQGGGIQYDASSRTVRWTADRLAATLDPSNRVIGIAFEVGVTPTASQTGQAAALLQDVRFTGTDAYTGAFVSASASTVTTQLPNDQRASGQGVVVE